MIVTTLGIAAALVAFAMLTSDSKRIAIYFCVGLIVVFAVFYGLGTSVTWAARRLPRPRLPELSLALGNLGAPGGLTRSVVLSLGAGLSLLVAVALADASLVRELEERLPTSSPDYFVLDVPKEDYDADERADCSGMSPARCSKRRRCCAGVSCASTTCRSRRSRRRRRRNGCSTAIAASPIPTRCRAARASSRASGGRRTTTASRWFRSSPSSPSKLGLKIGDKVTVNVLGRNVTATIANLREVKWESLAINFVMVFSPNTLPARRTTCW